MERKISLIVVAIFLILAGYFIVNKDVTKTDSLSEVHDKTIIGVYKGLMPCADCSGIDQVLTLYSNDTYDNSLTYQGKNTKPFIQSGKWQMTTGTPEYPDSTVYTLDPGTDNQQYYLVGDSGKTLTQLDREMKLITDSPFNMTLTKQASK